MTGVADRERFTALYQRYHAHVLAYALRRVGPDEAPDVLAETFTAAWRALANLPADPLPWLYRAAGYRIANQRRSTRRQDRLTHRMSGLVPPAGPDHAQQVVELDRVRAALLRLPATDREALVLVYWEDLAHAAAAYVLGCSTTALKVRLLRARRRLAKLLDDATDLPGGARPDAAPADINVLDPAKGTR